MGNCSHLTVDHGFSHRAPIGAMLGLAGGGISPTFAATRSQHSHALCGGPEIDVTDALRLGAMGRLEQYVSFGSAFVGQGQFPVNGQ